MKRQLYPIRHKAIFELYRKMEEAEWNESTVLAGIKRDANQIKTLKPDELALLKIPVASFSVIDNVITENIHLNYISYFNEPEYQLAFGTQSRTEGIHQICYGEFVKQYFEGEVNDQIVNEKTAWITKYVGLDPYLYLTKQEKRILGVSSPSFKKRLAYELFISTLLEGVDINSSFAIIFWFRERGLLPGFTTLNEYVEVDERLHYVLNYTIYNGLEWKLPAETAYRILQEWMDITKKQYLTIQNLTLPGISYDLLMTHIESVADEMLVATGYNRVYYSESPLKYMAKREVGIRSTRQFEAVSTEYNKIIFDEEDLELTF